MEICTGAPLRGGYPPPVAATLVWGGTPPNLDSSGAAAFKGGEPPPSHHQSLLLLRGGHLPLALREALLWRRPGREHLRFRTDELLLLRGGNPPHPSDLLLLRGGHPPQGCDQLLLLRWGGEPICIVLNRGSRTSCSLLRWARDNLK